MKSEWKRNKSYALLKTNELQAALEKTLSGLYMDAGRELKIKLEKYLESFAKRDAEMKAMLDAGLITKEYYSLWRLNNIGRGEQIETMVNQMADRLANVDKQAAAYINDTTPAIYALSHDYTCYNIKSMGIDGVSFTLTNERAVRELVTGGNHVTFKVVHPDRVRNYLWNQQRIQRTLTVGIVQGKSVDNIAVDFLRVQRNNLTAAIRNARTATTSAYNAGTQAAMDDAAEMGIKFKKMWIATDDDRTRDSHSMLDGITVDENEPFPNGLMYPCDPDGAPGEVYNCRCSIGYVTDNYDTFVNMDARSFEAWREEARKEGFSFDYEG